MEKDKKYINLDDKIQALKEDKKASQTKSQRLDKQGHKNDRRSYSTSRGRYDQGNYRNYTSLNDSQTHILMWIRRNYKEIRWLAKLILDKASKRGKSNTVCFMKMSIP